MTINKGMGDYSQLGVSVKAFPKEFDLLNDTYTLRRSSPANILPRDWCIVS